jgi:hypothetical protein
MVLVVSCTAELKGIVRAVQLLKQCCANLTMDYGSTAFMISLVL